MGDRLLGMSRSLLFLSTLLVCLVPFENHAHAQFQNRPNGMASAAPRTHALVHATLIPAPGQRVENATIVLRDGGVLSVESSGEVPPGAVVHDQTGHVVAPGFIDPSVLIEAENGNAAVWSTQNLISPAPRSLWIRESGPRTAERVSRWWPSSPAKVFFEERERCSPPPKKTGWPRVHGLGTPCKAWALTAEAAGALRVIPFL